MSETFTHVHSSCMKKPCRNAQHWKLMRGRLEIKDSVARIKAMRQQWHGLED